MPGLLVEPGQQGEILHFPSDKEHSRQLNNAIYVFTMPFLREQPQLWAPRMEGGGDTQRLP